MVPFVQVADVERSVAFYRLLGLEMRVTDPDGYCLMIAQLDDETLIR